MHHNIEFIQLWASIYKSYSYTQYSQSSTKGKKWSTFLKKNDTKGFHNNKSLYIFMFTKAPQILKINDITSKWNYQLFTVSIEQLLMKKT